MEDKTTLADIQKIFDDEKMGEITQAMQVRGWNQEDGWEVVNRFVIKRPENNGYYIQYKDTVLKLKAIEGSETKFKLKTDPEVKPWFDDGSHKTDNKVVNISGVSGSSIHISGISGRSGSTRIDRIKSDGSMKLDMDIMTKLKINRSKGDFSFELTF